MNALSLISAATIRGLAEAILALDMNHPHAFEAAVSIGAEIERTAGKVVEEADAARFNAVWGEPLVVLKQEADLHRALLEAICPAPRFPSIERGA